MDLDSFFRAHQLIELREGKIRLLGRVSSPHGFGAMVNGIHLDKRLVDLARKPVIDTLRADIEALEREINAAGVEVPSHFTKDADGWLKPTTPLAPTLIARGYNLVETGGGCKAWVRIMPDGEHVVVTSEDGGSEPQQDDWLIGRYADENWEGGYSVGTMDGESLEPFKKSLSDVESVTTTEESGHATESSPQKRGGRS